jgi:Pentapeptide repeats (9 copies)
MTFQRIDLLPRNNLNERRKARSRWESEEGRSLQEKIIALIRNGAGEDFLQSHFEHGTLSFIEDQWDLAGIQLFNEEIVFPTGDNFETIDFSYAQFWHCIFTNATFPQTHFGFTKFYNVEFRNCLFAFAHFYGATLEKCKFIDCDFAEENGFSNCELSETRFENCFFNKGKFVDCKFDEQVTFEVNKQPHIRGLRSQTSSGFKSPFERKGISGIYRGIKEGFIAGQIYGKARNYLFLQHQAYTRFNRTGAVEKSTAYSWELLAGYGLKPARVLMSLIGLFCAVFVWFAYQLGSFQESLIFTSGAFLTFGAKAELLQKLSLLNHIIYIFSAFVGVALVALFITVTASVLLKDN